MADFLPQTSSIERDRWSAALLPGERLIWAGQPRRDVFLRPLDALLIPFSLLWGGFALFWNATVWTESAPWFMRLFGLPFLLVDAWVIAGRFVSDAWWRRHTWYALTDRRVLVRSHFLPLQSADRQRLPALRLDEHRDGTGTIWFEPSGSFGWIGNRRGLWSPAFDRTLRFDRVRSARELYQQLIWP